MVFLSIFLLFIKVIQIASYKYEKINSFENKTIYLNSTNRYIIYELEHIDENRFYKGKIYIYFSKINTIPINISIYYNESHIYVDEEKEKILNFDEQQTLNDSFVSFYSHVGKIYLVFSNFKQDFSDNFQLIDTFGYSDITDYDIFKYTYKFEPLDDEFDTRRITFSFNNSIKQKNFIYYQIYNAYSESSGAMTVKTKTSKISLRADILEGVTDISKFKNESINIEFHAGFDCIFGTKMEYFDYYDILIFYSDYEYIYPLYNNETSFSFIPSIHHQKYYLFIDITKAYKNIFLNIKTTNNNFTGVYFFSQIDRPEKVYNLFNIDEIYLNCNKIQDNLYETQINLKDNYKSIIIKIETYYNDIEYKVNFFKSIRVNPFENYTFSLNEKNRFIIYDFINPIEYIYAYFQSYITNSTFIFLFSSIYNIYIDKNDTISGNDKKINLNSTILKLYYEKEKIYLLIVNFEENFSNTINIVNPYGYYDITNNRTFEYFYKLPYFNNNIEFTLSFNNNIKNKNFLIYQIFNYQNEQIDNTKIIEKNSLTKLKIENDNYNNDNRVVNLTNYKNGIIDLFFNISSKTEFNSVIILIYFSDYINLYGVSQQYDGNFYSPCIKPNKFFIYVDISKIYKNIFLIIESDKKNISNKYYFYDNNDINEIYSNMLDEEPNYNGIYTSCSRENFNNQMEIYIDKTDEIKQKALLLKMEIYSSTNISTFNYIFYNIKPFQNKTINLNEKRRFEIYEFENEYNGTIYMYFGNGKIDSTLISVYYDINKIKINEENGEILNFEEQKNLDGKTILTFKATIAKMYFVISNFKINFNDNIHLMNNYGYSDISNYEIFEYNFRYDSLNETVQRDITFSIKNDIIKKNYVIIQYMGNFQSYGTRVETKISKNLIKEIHYYTYNISNYKNETINIHLKVTTQKGNYYRILISYCDYENVYLLRKGEPNFFLIPNMINTRDYYLFIDITNAYDKIYLYFKTKKDYITRYHFKGKINFYESNKIEEISKNLPNYQIGIDMNYTQIDDDLFEALININNSSYKSVLIFIDNTYMNVEYKVQFFKPYEIYAFQNVSFNLNENQKYIIYEFDNPEGEFIYAYFKNGNITSSTYVYTYFDLDKIFINKTNESFLYYEDKQILNSNILKLPSKKGTNYIAISNFETNFSDAISIISPYSYYDITQNQTIQYFYKIPNPKNNIVITFSFNNKIRYSNFINYQIFNYDKEQIDNSQFYERDSLSNIPIDYYNYGGIVNLTNHKNDYINIIFNVSSPNKFDSMILSISFTNYKNLYKINSDNNYWVFIPSTNYNAFFIYTNISNFYKNIYFLIKTDSKNISNKYYFYNTDDINKISLNLPDDYYNPDGIYNSNLLGNNLHEIIIKKTDQNIQKSILLKMEIDSNINISLKVNYTINKIKNFENVTLNLYEKNRYAIYEYDNKENGIIYIYFSNGNMRNSKISVFYDIFKININEDEGEILDFEEQKDLDKKTFLSFKSFIGKMYFIISNYKDDFKDIFYIINTKGYNDITKYNIFRYTYNFDTTKISNEEITIGFSIDNNIKQKNFLYCQINNNKYALTDNSQIMLKSNKVINGYFDRYANITVYKNETIYIRVNASCPNIINSFEILIFYSDYEKIFELDSLIENNSLLVPSIKSTDFFIFININKTLRYLYLDVETSSLNSRSFYFYYTTNIKEIEKKIYSGDNHYFDTAKIKENQYQIKIYKYKKYASLIFEATLKDCATFRVFSFNKTIINSYEIVKFNLEILQKFRIFEFNSQNKYFENNIIDNENKFIYLYFNKSASKSIQVDIYINYSDIHIDDFNNNNAIDSFIRINTSYISFIELNNFYPKYYIIISDPTISYSDTNINSFYIFKNDDYFDITSNNIFKFNYRFNKTSEKRMISYKINTEDINYKYLHFQMNNYQADQKEYFSFTNLNGDNITFQNYCLNLSSNLNQTILMNIGLSSEQPIDNFDILIRQSNYYLIYPFNESNIIEIPFIKSALIYIYSNLPSKDGYTFISNTNQEEIEYYYLEEDKFNEDDINLLNLIPFKVKAEKQEDKNNTCFFNLKDEIKNFTVKKDNYKAVIIKMNIDNLTNFIITRKEHKIHHQTNENNNSNFNVKILVLIIIIIVLISLFVIFIIFRCWKKKKNKNLINMDVDNIGITENFIDNNNTKNELTPSVLKNGINKIEVTAIPMNDYNDDSEENKGYDNEYEPKKEKNNISFNNIINNDMEESDDLNNREKPKKNEGYELLPNVLNDNSFGNSINNRLNSFNSEDNNFAPPPIAQNNFNNKNY